MTSKETRIRKVLDGFQSNKGKGSLYCYDDSMICEIVCDAVTAFHMKRPKGRIFVVVDSLERRKLMLNAFRKAGITEPKGYIIRLLTQQYIIRKYSYGYDMTVLIGLNDDSTLIEYLESQSKFTLCILTKNIMDTKFITRVRNMLPDIGAGVIVKDEKARLDSPVEEYRIGIPMSAKVADSYKEYTEYINDSIKILGSLDNIVKCQYGDSTLNISAADFRRQLAYENGWAEGIDKKLDFMRSIDELYNPNEIRERAETFYSMARGRRDLVTDCPDKMERIFQLCFENRDRKVLIVSKRGAFAAKVTEYVNNCSRARHEYFTCGDYHDCLDSIPLLDDEGNPVLYKSGKKAGQERQVSWMYQSTENEKKFNEGRINILSIKSASDPRLKIDVDVVIVTSALCEGITDIKKRFRDMNFRTDPLKVYRLYMAGTIEQAALAKENTPSNIKVINDDVNDFIDINGSNGIMIDDDIDGIVL